jgi:hypothetical protein
MNMTVVRLTLALVASLAASKPVYAIHTCDDLGDPGWSALPTQEVVAVKDAAPFREGDNWFVERTTTVLPFCNYINASGNYSLRSYSLSPEDTTERVAICKGGAKVAPYSGSCPPR